MCADSVINCKSDKNSIKKAINHLFSKEFREVLKNVKNPYGEGGASSKIISKLENIDLNNILKKKFFNLDFKL